MVQKKCSIHQENWGVTVNSDCKRKLLQAMVQLYALDILLREGSACQLIILNTSLSSSLPISLDLWELIFYYQINEQLESLTAS